MFDCITIGAATVDIFVKSDHFKVKKDSDFITKYALSIGYSSKNEISSSLICSGGGATNSAVSMARFGLRSACLALVATDPLSAYISKDLLDNHVNRSLLAVDHHGQSDFSVILIAKDGGRTILTNRGNTRLEERHIMWSKLKNTKWFYISSLEGNMDLLEKIIGFAHDNKIKVSLNPGNRELSKLKLLKPFLPYVDFLLLNKTEAQMLIKSDYSDPEFWQKLKQLGSSVIAVTKGREGAHVLSAQGDYYSPIINTKPVDETGAGDGFGSTFIASLIHGHDLTTSLQWAVKNSASVVSYLGAKQGLLTTNQIQN